MSDLINDTSEAAQRIEKNLREKSYFLDLTSLNLTELPESIVQLTHLRSLDLKENKFSKIPEFISKLTGLTSLYLDSNQLAALPEWIGLLTSLEALYVSENSIAELPNSIGKLTKLLSLNFMGNNLAKLPHSFCQLLSLKHIYLSNNKLTALPESIGNLTRLERLFITGNYLTELPESFSALKGLAGLGLSRNKLTKLPEFIGSLTQLEELDVSYNQLTELPGSIGNLTKLKILHVHSNRLQTLPASLQKVSSLEEFYVQDNDALGIPAEIAGPWWHKVYKKEAQAAKPRGILEYYFRIRGGKRPLNEAKLVLVGRGAVGKTSLVNQLVHGKFDQGVKKTDGIRITEWGVQLKDDESVRLNVWDFGGQEIMHATHQFFLTKRSLYLVVINGREGGEDADAEYWLRLIESFGGESPIIIVLNKIKDHPFDLNRPALQQKFPSIRGFIKTDCEDGTGLEELRQAIMRETDQLEHLRDPFPASWFSIKDRLSGMKRDYLRFEEYRNLCIELGENDSSAQDSLAFYLHSLGIALNYKDDPRLHDTHVLNPHWVTNGIYKILNSAILERNKGELRLSDVSEILNVSEYPVGMRRFIFDLMKKFDLCFTFPDDDTHYLIPELLDKQEPEEAAEFNPRDCLNFNYRYSVLTEGLLPRFIVRTNALSEGMPRWRTGAILSFEGNRALVKADVQDKQVFISITGPLPGRRRLLAIIRSDFDRIHSEIRNLQPQEMVPLPEYPDVEVSYQELVVVEQSGLKKYPKVVNSKVVELDVHELLNGVDLEGTRRKDATLDEPRKLVRLFYSYSHKDESLRNQLESHLKILQREGLIDTWSDRKIEAGEDWKHRIDDNMERADIILLLVSSDFIASDYCYELEMKRALERYGNEETCVIPVIVRDVNWKKAPFARIQALPKDGLAVTKWEDRDSAWRNVSEGIERVVEKIRKGKGRSS